MTFAPPEDEYERGMADGPEVGAGARSLSGGSVDAWRSVPSAPPIASLEGLLDDRPAPAHPVPEGPIADLPEELRGKRYLTVGEVAELVGVTSQTVRNWADAGRIQSARTPGGHRRFPVPVVADLLRSLYGA